MRSEASKFQRMRTLFFLSPHFQKMAGVEELYKCFGILADAGDKIAEVLDIKLFDFAPLLCSHILELHKLVLF